VRLNPLVRFVTFLKNLESWIGQETSKIATKCRGEDKVGAKSWDLFGEGRLIISICPAVLNVLVLFPFV